MRRLVDANEIKGHFPQDEDWDYPVNTNSRVVEIIDNAPTVDAIEVVRCKDCKWYHNANDKYFPRTCDHWSEMFYHYEDWESVDENGFCSWGERREHDNDN